MFALTPYRWNALQVPQSLFDVEEIFDNFFSDSLFPEISEKIGNMKVDIRDNEKAYVLETDLPGLKKEELKLEFKNDCLTISVEHNETVEQQKENYLRKERRYNSAARTFSFKNIDEESISAAYENGVLIVTLPKKEAQTKGYQIPIA